MSGAVGIAYLIASLTFIFGLRQLSSPVTARMGNRIAAVGMAIALIATLIDAGSNNWWLIAPGIVIGAIIGIVSARQVHMTAMPQMVALFNGMGGGAAALVSTLELLRLSTESKLAPADQAVTILLGAAIGSISFAGSLIAFGKLQELITGNPVTYPGQKFVNGIIVAAMVGLGIYVGAFSANREAYAAIIVLALVLGVGIVLPIGGADMPVVISLMNSLTGLAAALTGFVLRNELLIVAGALVGASGTLLTLLMARAMNRPVTNVLFGAFGGTVEPVAGGSGGGTVREVSAEDAAVLMAYAREVVIVPGYGLAVAQAQHQARELGDLLARRGVDVKYAIHPVAGRMPGHMNVLLAEADVPYDRLKEMEEINGEFPRTDVALVVGANDVVNPAAHTDPSSPIYGMPILDVDQAANVIVLKRSMRSGFAGIDNPLFYEPKTSMLFGDARDSLTRLVNAVKAA
jgi:NAD(P) transhydrogenase subunit beta